MWRTYKTFIVFYYDIQFQSFQKTGSGLGGRVRSQINIQMSKVEGVKQAEGLRDLLLPVVWFSDDIDEVNDEELVAKIRSSL